MPGPHNVMQQVAIPPPPPGPPPAPQVHGNQARQAARGQWRGGQAPPPLPPPPLLRQQAINRRVPDSDGSASTRSGTRASSNMSANISSRASSAAAPGPSAPRFRSVRRRRNDSPVTGGRNQAAQAMDLSSRVQASIDQAEGPWDATRLQRELHVLLWQNGLQAIDLVRSWDRGERFAVRLQAHEWVQGARASLPWQP